MATTPKPRLNQEVRRLLQYFVSGGAYFWSGYLIIVLLTPVIGLWWANLLGNSVGVSLNFFLQRYWVFVEGKGQRLTQVTGKYIGFTLCNFLINYGILRALQNVGVPVAVGQFIAAAFFTVWNYLWYRAWIFKIPTKAKRK